MLLDSRLLQHRLTRVVPHVIDTLLFVSGISMAIMGYGSFYRQDWLLGKLVALIIYIALGSIAIRYGKPKGVRAAAFVAALGVFAYIVLVARTHSLVPVLGGTRRIGNGD